MPVLAEVDSYGTRLTISALFNAVTSSSRQDLQQGLIISAIANKSLCGTPIYKFVTLTVLPSQIQDPWLLEPLTLAHVQVQSSLGQANSYCVKSIAKVLTIPTPRLPKPQIDVCVETVLNGTHIRNFALLTAL